MVKLDTYKLIYIGLMLRYLRTETFTDVDHLKKNIEEFIEKISDAVLNFSVSVSAADKLMEFSEELSKQTEKLISNGQKTRLKSLMGDLENVIFAESRTKFLFMFSERRYNINFMLNHPDRLFADEVGQSLSDISKFDFSQGFECIVYGQATAAAFHILRGTEGVLKDYYFKNIKKNREKKPMWGNMVEGLRKKTRNKPPAVLMESLDLIRKSYRNPTNHPELIYTLEEAQDLLGVCIDVINKMVLSMR